MPRVSSDEPRDQLPGRSCRKSASSHAVGHAVRSDVGHDPVLESLTLLRRLFWGPCTALTPTCEPLTPWTKERFTSVTR